MPVRPKSLRKWNIQSATGMYYNGKGWGIWIDRAIYAEEEKKKTVLPLYGIWRLNNDIR